VLDAVLTVGTTFLTGSYQRSTMIRPLKEADIDVFAVLDTKYFYNYNNGQNGGQAGLLDLVRRTLLRTYTRTPDISRNGQAVSIRFDDFVIDVVPGFNRQGGGFLIPDSIGAKWIETDPKRHVELVSASNKTHNGDLVPLIKMIKAWNRAHGSYFRSFHLEVLALEIFQGVTISDFPSGIRYYFDKARALISKQNVDPAGYGDDVGRYLNGSDKVRVATTRFESAYEDALKAEQWGHQMYVKSAVDSWAKVLGEYFPAYG